MEETPKIIMQCPKCSREYSPDTSYCEACSVSLEPVEISAPDSSAETERQEPADIAVLDEKGEILDEVRIDSLKTEIELTFTRTLLLELAQLKKRLRTNLPRTKAADTAFQPGMSEDKSGAEYIEKRIAKLEAMLYNLGKKIEADISDLQTRLGSMKRPGVTGLLTDKGRIYRMLSSELKTKYTVLHSIQTRVPASPLQNFFRPSPVKAVAVIALVALIAATWIVFSTTRKTQIPVAPFQGSTARNAEGTPIGRDDITSLLEDIKAANLQKDLSRWKSRYSKNYLAMEGKKENIQGLWNNFDYLSLDYRIEQLNIQPKTASARITWEMQLRSRDTGKIIRKSQTLSADFVREDNTFKISAVRRKVL